MGGTPEPMPTVCFSYWIPTEHCYTLLYSFVETATLDFCYIPNTWNNNSMFNNE